MQPGFPSLLSCTGCAGFRVFGFRSLWCWSDWRLSICAAEDATWSHQCFDCDVDAVPSAAGRPTGFVVALLALLSGFFLSDANTGTGTGCYDTETHRCDCTVTETVCLARQGHWTDTCRSCDATTNEQHPDCQRQYSWGCFDEASHACECTVSERACDAAAGKTWTHECLGLQLPVCLVLSVFRILKQHPTTSTQDLKWKS